MARNGNDGSGSPISRSPASLWPSDITKVRFPIQGNRDQLIAKCEGRGTFQAFVSGFPDPDRHDEAKHPFVYGPALPKYRREGGI